jgi:serine/threonine-protein kinase
MIGRVIGRYRVIGFLGRGGMGSVYRAHDNRLARDIALKFLPLHVAEEPDAARRFLVEARAAAALSHPNVCTVYEIGEAEDGHPFISMALYAGETLKPRLRRGPLPQREAATIARELASALAAAHARGIVHRDVKPGNVMLAVDGLARLLDFGLAQVGDASSSGNGATPGTISYMSPEQARGVVLDHRSDLWSLGVVLHEMLAGARPFVGGGDRIVSQRILHDAPTPLDSSVSEGLRRIVERLLRKTREERYHDAATLEADLAAWLGTSPPRPRRSLKRRTAAVVAAAVVLVSVIAALRSRAAVSTLPRASFRSLAVLPFNDLGANAADRYFSDGLTEEITSALGHIAGLRVAARTSAFALRDKALDVRRIGDTLGVDAVLEGSVRHAGNRMRVTTQLVDAHTGLNIWTGEYDREIADVLGMQDEIARAIAGALELRLPREAIARRPGGTNPAAYDLYLQALPLRNSMSSDALQHAGDLLDRAIELQPDFALAHAVKASVIAPRVFFRQIPQDEGLRAVRASIDRAFALDPNLGEALVSRGLVQLFFERDWTGAERSLRRAVEVDPNNAHAWHHLGNYFRAMARPDEAAEARLRGIALDPLNARLRGSLGEEYLYAGRWDDALAAFARAAQLDPLHPILLGRSNPPDGPARVYLAQGRETEAVQDLLRVATLRGGTVDEVDALRTAYRTGGMHGFWREWLAMDRRQTGPSIDPLRVSMLYAMAGDTAQAMEFLERAYAEGNPGLIFMRTEPAFASVRAQPRYMRVEAAMAFPPNGR